MRLFRHQLRGEQRLYWRSRELAFFTFLFPVLIFLLLGVVIMLLQWRVEPGFFRRKAELPPPEVQL